jgi:SAV_6107-like HEPN
MISTLATAGTPARNALPPSAEPTGPGSMSSGPMSTGPMSTGPMRTGPMSTASMNTGSMSTGPAGQLPAGALPMPRSVPGAALSLLRTARQGLAEAEAETDAGTRYIGAHLAALRAAAAIVAARGEPGTGARRRRPRSVWELLPQVEPALAEWAAFFAASAAKRAAAEAGLPRAATAREADDLLRDASTFLMVAERALGLESEPMLPLSLRHAS